MPWLPIAASAVSLAMMAGSFIYSLVKGTPSSSSAQQAAASLNINSSNYGLSLPVIAGTVRLPGNLLAFEDFKAIPHTTTQSMGGSNLGGGASASSTTYIYKVSFLLGLCAGPITGIGIVWVGKQRQSGWSFLSGSATQNPWSYMVSKHPSRALAYRGLALIPKANYDLGDYPALPEFSFEVSNALATGADGDANMADFIEALLTDTKYGVGWPVARLHAASLANYRAYCNAADLLISPVLSDSKPVRDHLADLLRITNADVVQSGGQLKFAPLGDRAESGNGVDWTPDLTPAALLQGDDFIVARAGEPPITCSRLENSDLYNVVELEILDRDSDYNSLVVSADDQAGIDELGFKNAKKENYPQITRGQVGRHVAQVLLQRQRYIRNVAKFRLTWRHICLEPLDYVALTYPPFGWEQKLFQLISRTEQENDNYEWSAEEYLGIYSSPAYPVQAARRRSPAEIHSPTPGRLRRLAVFAPPAALAGGEYEIWIAALGGGGDSGTPPGGRHNPWHYEPLGNNWGGCQIWAADDGETYKQIGVLRAKSRMGVLYSDLEPAPASPDEDHALLVDTSYPTAPGEKSGFDLPDSTEGAANNGRTRCWLDGEYLAYGHAAATLEFWQYVLTYLPRGLYSGKMGLHLTGAPLVRLDEDIFKYRPDVADIGKTVYLKFLGFNLVGQQVQQLDEVESFEFTLPAADAHVWSGPEGLRLAPDPSDPGGAVALAVASIDLGGYTVSDLAAVLDLSATGLNGLDTGVPEADTLYYIWVISNGSIDGGLISKSATAPALPSGYTYLRRVGFFWTAGAAQIVTFRQADDIYEGTLLSLTGATLQDWTEQDLSAALPVMAARAWLILAATAGADAEVALGVRPPGSQGEMGQIFEYLEAGAAGAASGWCDLPASRKVELRVSATADWTLTVAGLTLEL